MCMFFGLKCCFIFFNTLFLLSGVALITIGVLQYSTYSEIGTFTGSSLSQIAIVLIAVGVTIAFVSLLGHIGAFFNNSSMVACFICILIVIILLEVLTGAAFYIFRSRVRHLPILPKRELLELKTALLQISGAVNTKARAVISDYSPERRHAINTVQEKFKCCGADSYADWSQSVGWENHNAVPDSCCVEKSEGCGQEKEKVHKKGCLSAIKFFLMKNLVWVGAVCIALGVTEVFGVLIGVCLCLDIKKNYETIR